MKSTRRRNKSSKRRASLLHKNRKAIMRTHGKLRKKRNGRLGF